MKHEILLSGLHIDRRSLPWLTFVVILALVSEIRLQAAPQTNDFLPPPKPGLVALHWPDLSKLEPEVRIQLMSLQSALAIAARNPATSEVTLSEAYGTLGEIYHAYSLTSPARECYLNANELAAKDFRWVYLRGRLDQQDGRIDEAIRRYRIASRMRPDYVAVWLNLGDIYLQSNRLEDAEENFKTALEIEKSNSAAYYGLGQIALSRRRYAEAVDYFEKALVSAPQANRIHYSLAMAYRGTGNAEKAKQHLAQQGPVGVRPADPLVEGLQLLIKGERVHLIRGRLALEARRYQEAADEFRKAIAAKADSVPAHINLGAALTQTGNSQEAAAQFEEALRIDPQNAVAHYNLALLLAREEKHELAILHLQSVLRLYPDDRGARFLLAQELLKFSRPEEALSEFARVVQADPNNEEALLEQAKLLLRQKHYREALNSVEQGHAQYPQKQQTAVMLAYLLAASPRYDLRNGQRALELAQTIYQTTGQVNHGVLVALALAELGNCDEAAAWLRQMRGQALREGKPDLVERIKGELDRYERGRPCRPDTDTTLIGQPKA